jgi:AraC-like DNA-binding protein
METSFKLLAALDLLGVAQALLLASVLLSVKRGNRTANRFLAAFLIAIAISVGGATLSNMQFVLLFPHLLKIQQPFYFLGAPLLFLYVRALISRKSGLEKKDLLHFIPFSLCVLYLVPYYLQSSEAELHPASSYYGQPWYIVRSALLLFQFLVYLILIVSTVVSYSRRVKNQTSLADRAILFQVRFLMMTFLALWVLGFLHYILTISYPSYNNAVTDLIVPVYLSAFVYALGYIGLRKPAAVTGIDDLPPPSIKYEKSTLTVERADAYLTRLLDLMEKERPFIDGDLTLQKLAKALAMPPHHLSQIINEQLNQNFFDFINLYRVEEAKRMLIDPAKKHYSILSISEAVGFNSKSAFNTAFKKHAHLTPSEFRKVAAGNGEQS